MEELHKKNRTGKEYFYMIIKKYNSIKKIEEIYDELYNSLPKKHAFQSLSFLKQTDTLYYKLRWRSSVSYYVVFEQDKPILIAGFRKYNKDTVILLGSRAGNFIYFYYIYKFFNSCEGITVNFPKFPNNIFNLASF